MHVSSITQKLAICVIPVAMSEENRAAAVMLLNAENISFFFLFIQIMFGTFIYLFIFLIVISVAWPSDVPRFFGSLVSLLGLAYFKVDLLSKLCFSSCSNSSLENDACVIDTFGKK